MIDPFEKLMEDITGQQKVEVLKNVLGDQYVAYESVQHLTEIRGIQARLPFFIEIK